MKWFVSGVLFACCVITPATERVQRRFDSTTGLTVSTIFSLAQDAEGFIWIGTAGGVVRYDGNQMRPWAKDIINRDVFTLSVSPAGEVIVAEGPGTLYRVTAEGVAPVPGPGGQPFNQTWTAGFDDVGRLWVVTETGELHFRDLAGVWTAMDVAGNFPGEQVRRMRTGSDSYVYILTNKAVWKLRVGERPRRILEVMRPLDVVESRDGSVFVLAWQIDGEVIQIRPDGTSISRAKIDSRPIDLAIRGDVIWALTSGHLVSLRGDEPAQISEVPSGGPLLVDHEGSLWLGSFTGLIQYPEPETTIFGARDGITNIHTRTLERTDEGIWVGTWGNINRIAREGNQWRVHDEKIQGLPCLDDRGVLLAAKMEEGIFQRRDGRFVRLSSFGRGSSYPYSCMRASDGSLLSASAGGLFRIEIDGRPPTLLSSPNSENGNPIALARVFEDGERIWAGTGDGRICHGKAAEILAGRPVSWACQLIDPSVNIFDFARLSSGSLWMSTGGAGIWRLRGELWEQIPASRSLESQRLFNLTPSPAGGVWLIGHGTIIRVVERADIAAGWEVVEVLSTWEGLPGSDAGDLLEERDGNLWLATSLGVIRVPAEARRAESQPPRVKLVNTVINGHRVNADAQSSLPYGSQVELHFAALSFRDRGRLRYQYRLRPDTPWINSDDSAPVLRFVDLGAGDYQAEVRASLDGINWTPVPARLAFRVLNPWYLRPITLLLFVVLTAAGLYLIYRARVRAMLRLEQQRSQIAMDLHDEMGSGLGSIGILSGLAAQDDLKGLKRQDLAKQIANTAGELGNSLGEIVWALKPGAATLEALAYHVAERGGRLFPSDEPAFATEFPLIWPKVNLSLAVRRNLLLITSEALHNAARHSQARQVTLGLQPDRGKQWRLWVADDGCGVENGNGASGLGLGLTSMRRRADEIGAAISWASKNGRGTVVSVVFDPRAEHQRFE